MLRRRLVFTISMTLWFSELSPWTDWTPCSKTCGTGDRTRTRNCVIKDCPICAFGRDEKNPCGAPLFERQLCNQQVGQLVLAATVASVASVTAICTNYSESMAFISLNLGTQLQSGKVFAKMSADRLVWAHQLKSNELNLGFV